MTMTEAHFRVNGTAEDERGRCGAGGRHLETLVGRIGSLWWLGWRTRLGAIGRQPVMANTHEPRRQHVQQEAADELLGIQRHRLAPVAVGVILVAKAYFGTFKRAFGYTSPLR